MTEPTDLNGRGTDGTKGRTGAALNTVTVVGPGHTQFDLKYTASSYRCIHSPRELLL